jgi:seryl-tRNA synthetase
MFDFNEFAQRIDEIEKKLATRGFVLDKKSIIHLFNERKTYLASSQELQQKRNALSKDIGIKKSKGESVDVLMDEVKLINNQLKVEADALATCLSELQALISAVPNIPHSDTPVGKDDSDNVTKSSWGEPKTFGFEPKDHVTLGEALGGLDFDAASAMSGSRFVVMKGALARLHRALIQFMMDKHTQEHGYLELNVPYIVQESALFGTGQLPKFRDDQFFISDPESFLIPTGEVPITNLVADQIVMRDQLPLKYVAHTPCFRKEAGAYGQDTRGMIRMHQFEKVELVQIAPPDESEAAFHELVDHAKTILEALGLPYRVRQLCTGDLGFAANRTIDLEVWVASQKTYREISSCSHFDAFQARRLKARWRAKPQDKTQLLHTVNGSGLAVGRTMVALMESYQQADGSIIMPDVLRPYLGGDSVIKV